MTLAGVRRKAGARGTQSIEAQRQALGGNFDREFIDEAVRGPTLAADRPAFGKLLSYVREGDAVCIY